MRGAMYTDGSLSTWTRRNDVRSPATFSGLCVILGTAFVFAGGDLAAQNTVLSRKPATFQGEIVDLTCYRTKGISTGTGAEHIACAKECAGKGLPLGILTDGEGVFRIVGGDWEKNHYAKLLPFVGQWVEVKGAEVQISNNYDVRTFELETIVPSHKDSK
jgi:hypothetical protein